MIHDRPRVPTEALRQHHYGRIQPMEPYTWSEVIRAGGGWCAYVKGVALVAGVLGVVAVLFVMVTP